MKKDIDYKRLYKLMGRIIEEAKQAQAECLKEHPDEVLICDHAVENMDALFEEVNECVLSFGH